MAFRLRRGTDAERLLITPEEGELIYTTDTKKIYVGDGTTLGGNIVNTEIELGDVGGVDLSTPPSAGQSLQYDGANWIPGNITGILEGSTFRIDVSGNILGTDSSILLDNDSSLLVMDTVSANTITGATITGNLIGNGSAITDMVTTNLEDWSKSAPNAGDTVQWNAVESVWQPTNFLTVNGNFTGTFNGTINASGNLVGDTQGSVFGQDSAVIIDGSSSRVVGKIDTGTRVDVVQTDASDQVLVRGTGLAKPGAIGPQILFQTSTGTIDAPTTVVGGTTGDALGEVQGAGYDGTNYNIAGIVRIATDLDSTVSPGVVPGRVMFITANSAGNLQNLLLFNSQGYLGLGTPRPDEKLHVNNGNAKIDGFVQFGSLTTGERDALTAANGMVIYNTTDNKFQGYENGAWVNLI